MSERTCRTTQLQTCSEEKLISSGLHSTETELLKEQTKKRSLQHQQATGWKPSNIWPDKEMTKTKASLAAFHSGYKPSNIDKRNGNNVQPFGIPVYVLCKVCRKQKNRSASEVSASSNVATPSLGQNCVPVMSKTLLSTDPVFQDFDCSDFRFQIWPCSSCGTLIKIKSEELTQVRSGPYTRKRSKKGKLRKQLSKMHKTLRSSMGASPEISEDLSNTSAIENDQSVTSNHVTPSHSRSASNTSRSQYSYNGSDYEGCDVVEYNDCNGQYLVVKQRSIAGSDIDYDTRQVELRPEAADGEAVDSTNSPADSHCFEPTGERGNISLISSAGTRSANHSGLTRVQTTPSPLVKKREANDNPNRLKSSSASSLHPSNSWPKDREFSAESKISLSPNFASPSPSTQENSFADIAVSYKSRDGTLFLPIPEPHNYKMTKQGVRKKKVLSQSYKQKNDDFHKFFSDLPETERLVVDYTCAWIKDILVQGRMYVSQNYVCFYSNILKWQTATVMSFKDIQHITKEKTVKLFPNAIQFQTDGHDKPKTFTSFTQRDRAFQQITKLWHNALADKPMTPQELWGKVHHNYGSELGCSSEEDYVRPGSETLTREAKNSSDSKKAKRKKKAATAHRNDHGKEKDKLSLKTDAGNEQPNRPTPGDQFSDEGKTSSRESMEDPLVESMEASDGSYGPVEHCKEDLRRTYLDREYNVSAAVMFQTLFGDDSNFMYDYLEGRGSLDIFVGKWENGVEEDKGEKVKQLHYCLPLNNPLVPKLSKVEERQVYRKESKLDRCYSVDCHAHMRGAPYTEYFVSIMRYCIRRIDKNVCELRVTAEVNYKKHPWGFVKTFIEKNVISGMNENFSLLERELDRFFLSNGHLQTSSCPPTSHLRQRNSASSSEQKEPKYSSSPDPVLGGDAQSLPLPQNGDVPNHVHSNGKDIKAAPSTSALAVPCDVGSGGGLSEIRHLAETRWSKWIIVFLVTMLFLLIWSNYTMHRRLVLLESSHPHSTSTEFHYSTHHDINGIYDVDNTNDVSVREELMNLERRLARIEAVVQDHMTLSERGQKELQNTLNEISDALKT